MKPALLAVWLALPLTGLSQVAVQLDGAAADPDNFPGPQATRWSVVSTPTGGWAMFLDVVDPVTVATLSDIEGTYVLRLTQSDGLSTGQDDVTITLQRNTPPAPDAGPDQVIPIAGAVPVLAGMQTSQLVASDNVGVEAVQFTLNGAPLGPELPGTLTPDTPATYQLTWDTRQFQDGTYQLSATARDAAGNVGTSTPVAIRVRQ